MVNYDLPWNPNRIEQRFGRIHRIGQTEVCHLWNLVAAETREGEVFDALLKKIEREREALGGQVFDVLGQLRFENRPLRELLLEAIRYGERPEVRERLTRAVDEALDREHLRRLIEERALVHDALDVAQVRQIREDMERAEARRLQPHFIASFFLEAFQLLGGAIRAREPGGYEVTHVPALIRTRDRQIGTGAPVLRRYERITFEKHLIAVPGKPLADFVCPGHPLLDATIDLILERHRDLLQRGSILVDATDSGEEIRALCYLEHAIQDARTDRAGNRRVVSRQLQFVELDQNGTARTAGYAPYLDYRPLAEDEQPLVGQVLRETWLHDQLESKAVAHAISEIVPRHLAEVRKRKEELVTKATTAIRSRLLAEINYWDHRAIELRAQEEAGKTPRLNSEKARQRADELQARLQTRLQELEQERLLSALPPVVVGGALVVPAGLLARVKSERPPVPSTFAADTAQVERLAMEAVIAAEERLGYVPWDVSADKLGWDVESRIPGTGRLRFIEVKGRAAGSQTVTVTKNEIIAGLNKPDDYVLAIVEVNDGGAGTPCYVRRPFRREPDFGVTSVNYNLPELLSRSEEPA